MTSSEASATATVWQRVAQHLREQEDVLAEKVTQRCFQELESYHSDRIAREESVSSVQRLLEHIIRELEAASSSDIAADAQAFHADLVRLEEGIAARRVKMAVEFDDIIAGIHFMRREVWASLSQSFAQLEASLLFRLEARINSVLDDFLTGLASAYRKSQREMMAHHESALAKWEEVVKSASQIRLKIPCREEFAAIVRLQAEAIARRVWFSEDEIYDIITAVGEVCDNAIEHGKSEMGIDVQYLMTLEEFSVEVQDYGCGFDPSGRGEEVPDLYNERGRGIFLMKNLMDRVEIDSVADRGTRIVMAKARKFKD